MPRAAPSYEELLRFPWSESEVTDGAIFRLGTLIDAAWDRGDLAAIGIARAAAEAFAARTTDPTQATRIAYFRANSWAAERQAKDPERRRAFDWVQPEAEQEMISLRKALISPGFAAIGLEHRLAILTNLAGRLDEFGRPFEALEYWDQALQGRADFGMALGNKGIGLKEMSRYLYDEGHAAIFIREAVAHLERSIASPSTYEPVRPHFREILAALPDFDRRHDWRAHSRKVSLGRSGSERAYRKFCLANRLFLNPLNDLTAEAIAARDVTALPAILTNGARMPVFFGFYNQLKQEYVSARYSYYQSISASGPHFSDREVRLVNTLDYPAIGYHSELMRGAYRTCYSLLDKIAYFLRSYFELRVPANRTYFKTLWFVNGDRNLGLEPRLAESKNVPLRGLFWLSKDIFDDSPDFKVALDPDAQEMKVIRDHLEHKYFTLHDDLFDPSAEANRERRDPLAYAMRLRDFEKRALRMIKLARSAILHLSLALHIEERRKRSAAGDGPTVEMPMGDLDDAWKRRL